jgi:hypothetical protein
MPIRNAQQAEEERMVFEAFLRAYPSFADTVESWRQPDGEFPDITVKLAGRGAIGFELTEWLHGEQMASAIRLKRLIDAIDSATVAVGPNVSSYIYSVMLVLRDDGPLQRFDPTDTTPFQRQMKELIEETESRWPTERLWHSSQGRHVSAFQDRPCLGKYLSRIVLYPLAPRGRAPLQKRPAGIPWIFVSRATSYSPSSALNALKEAMSAKVNRYGHFKEPVRLLVHYGRAAAYNTPFIGARIHEFQDVAEAAARMAAGQKTFERIYLLSVLNPGPQAYEIFPRFLKCA